MRQRKKPIRGLAASFSSYVGIRVSLAQLEHASRAILEMNGEVGEIVVFVEHWLSNLCRGISGLQAGVTQLFSPKKIAKLVRFPDKARMIFGQGKSPLIFRLFFHAHTNFTNRQSPAPIASQRSRSGSAIFPPVTAKGLDMRFCFVRMRGFHGEVDEWLKSHAWKACSG